MGCNTPMDAKLINTTNGLEYIDSSMYIANGTHITIKLKPTTHGKIKYYKEKVHIPLDLISPQDKQTPKRSENNCDIAFTYADSQKKPKHTLPIDLLPLSHIEDDDVKKDVDSEHILQLNTNTNSRSASVSAMSPSM